MTRTVESSGLPYKLILEDDKRPYIVVTDDSSEGITDMDRMVMLFMIFRELERISSRLDGISSLMGDDDSNFNGWTRGM